jgi:hypothetical protein
MKYTKRSLDGFIARGCSRHGRQRELRARLEQLVRGLERGQHGLGADLGFGRLVVSEKEAPIISVNLV